MIRNVTTFLAAVLTTYVVAAVLATQSVLSSLADLGVPLTVGQRLTVTGHDLLGMASSYMPLLAIAFLIAFPLAAWISRRWPQYKVSLYALAGAVAVIAIHIGLNLAFGITPVAAARTMGGLLLQSAAGALGGCVYARVAGRSATKRFVTS